MKLKRAGYVARVFLMMWGVGLCCCGIQQADDGKPVVPLEEYTALNPDRWESIEDSHVPRIEIINDTGKSYYVKIWVDNFQWQPDHYLEKIGIMDENKRDLNVRIFPRTRVLDVTAVFPLPSDWKGQQLKAFVKCSRHDLWTAPVKAAGGKQVQPAENGM